MLLDIAHQRLGWPSRAAVLSPAGAGPSVFARLVQAKLGRALLQRPDVQGIEIGVLAADPSADATEAPLAVVCEFATVASVAAIEEAHRLAWNFCRSPLLLTLEPHQIRAWSSCEPPAGPEDARPLATEIRELRVDPRQPIDFASAAARALSWVSLASGQLFRDFAPRFKRENCADETLLDNLKVVRDRLHAEGLPLDITHDLLARLMFVQFLFHRKDDDGRAALSPAWLNRQYEEGKLSSPHASLESVLRNRHDTYALFRMLNDRFNGDLFPGKSSDPAAREAEWRAEMEMVSAVHLERLADFVGGKLVLHSGQRSLWPLYSFDIIPLEFISSIYEAFVSKDKGTHYTPGHLVDVVLDTCLPWDDERWDVRVLDPSCGSGIFLVKAFQRLVHRWHRANGFDVQPGADVLRKLLSENLFGIDIQRDAVRVASFSLYLAMCDEIEPRHVWDRVKFPPLRDRRLIEADFFRDDQPGFGTLPNRATFDVVVGNAPWGAGTLTGPARAWAKSYGWGTSYKNIGPLFLAKAAWLTKVGGRVSMLQPSGLLFNTVKPASRFRKRLFEKYRIEQIVNLSALRFGLFQHAVSPACVVCLEPSVPDTRPITYVAPKPALSADDDFRIVFDAYDSHAVLLHEATRDPTIWTTLTWGGRRDHALLRRLTAFPTIEKLEANKLVKSRKGIKRGSNPTKFQQELVDAPILEGDDFPAEGFPFLDPAALPKNAEPRTHWKDSTDWTAFRPPQLIVKVAWRRSTDRFQARVVPEKAKRGIVCSASYVSVHFPAEQRQALQSACASYNSIIATYYLLHTSHRFTYLQEVNKNELLRVPFPRSAISLNEIAVPSDADQIVRRGFALKDAEWTLVEDALNYTLAAFKATRPGLEQQPRGRRPRDAAEATALVASQLEGVTPDMLGQYGRTFARVIRGGFGQDKRLRTTVYRTPSEFPAPVHLVAVHLGWPDDGEDEIQFVDVATNDLLSRIVELSLLLEQRTQDGTTLRRRVARVYDVVSQGRQRIPTVYLCKPSQPRYWTRSMAMRDADEVAADLKVFAQARQASRRTVRG